MDKKIENILLKYFKAKWKLLEVQRDFIQELKEKSSKEPCFISQNDISFTMQGVKLILIEYSKLEAKIYSYREILHDFEIDINEYTAFNLEQIISKKELEELYGIKSSRNIIRVDKDLEDDNILILSYENGEYEKVSKIK